MLNRLNGCRSLLVLFTSIAMVGDGWAAEVRVSPKDDVDRVAKSLRGGDVLVLENGRWRDVRLTLDRLPGTEASPIHIRSETPGGAVFTGQSSLRLSGRHAIVSGLVFRDLVGISDPVQLRSHSERLAEHCRITDCVFEQASSSGEADTSRWLSVYGTHNRVDHCYFAGKTNPGTTLVVWVGSHAGKHRIDHNHFGPRPPLGSNGGETIRIGTSDVSEWDSATVVEDNYFHRCDGEAEIVSNKSCGNIYRYNVFDTCSGALTLRHGHRCVVDANQFLGRQARGTGGVRIIGRDHIVTNNYFEGLRGDAERAAISLMNGVPDGPLHLYAPVVAAVVSNNTFIDCKVTFEIGVGAGKKHSGKTQSAAPSRCVFTHNMVQPVKWSVFRIHAVMSDTLWSSNLLQPGKRAAGGPFDFSERQFGLMRHETGMMRPFDADALRSETKSPVEFDIDGQRRTDRTLAGCDDPVTPKRRPISPANTGPRWQTQMRKSLSQK